MVTPMPTATPSTAAMIGFLLVMRARTKASELRGLASSRLVAASLTKSPTSSPAVKTPDRPVRIRQRTSGLDCA